MKFITRLQLYEISIEIDDKGNLTIKNIRLCSKHLKCNQIQHEIINNFIKIKFFVIKTQFLFLIYHFYMEMFVKFKLNLKISPIFKFYLLNYFIQNIRNNLIN